jgi:hypothetical protein
VPVDWRKVALVIAAAAALAGLIGLIANLA